MDPSNKEMKLLKPPFLTTPDRRLFHALDKRNIAEVLKQDPDINVNEINGARETCLYRACQMVDKEAIEALLQHPSIDVNAGNGWGETPLMALTDRCLGHRDPKTLPYHIFQLFFMHENVNLNAMANDGVSVLHYLVLAIYEGDNGLFELTKQLLQLKRKRGILNVNLKETGGNPAWAYRRNFTTDYSEQFGIVLSLIIKHESFDVNTTDSKGKTLLMMIIGHWFMENTVNLLLDHPDINLDMVDREGKTVTHHLLCSLKSHKLSENEQKLLRYLLTGGKINTNMVDKEGTTFLMQAVRADCKETVDLILENCNPDINYQDTKGNTAIMLSENDEIMSRLIKCNADVNIMNRLRLTLLRKAVQKYNAKVIQTVVHLDSYVINRVHQDELTDLMWLWHEATQTTRKSFIQFRGNTDTYIKWISNITTQVFLQHPECDVVITNKENQTVFHFLHTFLDILQYFLGHKSYQKGVLNKQDMFGKTFMHRLCETDIQTQLQKSTKTVDEVLKILLDELTDPVVDFNLQDCAGNTPLMIALHSQDPVISALMLQLLGKVPQKFDFSFNNKKLQSALSIARMNKGLDPQIKEIVEANSNPEMTYYSHLSIPEQLKFLSRSVKQLPSLPIEVKEDLQLLIENLKTQIEYVCQGNYQTFGMSQHQREKLRGCNLFLLLHLETGMLLTYLHQERVISQTEKENIEVLSSRTDRVNKLLALLPTHGPDTYDKFLSGLRETEQGHIADRLEKWEPSDSVMADDVGEGMAVVRPNQSQLAQLFLEISQAMSPTRELT